MTAGIFKLARAGATLVLVAGAVLPGCSGDSRSSGTDDDSAARAGSAGLGASAAGRGGAAAGRSPGAGQGGHAGAEQTAAGRGGAGRGGGAGGAGGAGGTAGGIGVGGDSGANAGGEPAASGGAGAAEASAGQSGAAESAGDDGNGGATSGCEPVSVTASVVIPTVELLIDNSASMFSTTPTAWASFYGALMDASSGVVKNLEDKIRFGFLSYKGSKGTSETDPACATMTGVTPALDNYDAINATYVDLGGDYSQQHPPPRWESPGNYAIAYAAATLTDPGLPAGPKYILLATDGSPNTCEVLDPQCGEDRAVKAAQDAYAAGVGLMVVGLGGDFSQADSGCTDGQDHCGLDHLNDLANAGVGAPVLPPPGCDDPTADSCFARFDICNKGALIAAYTPDAAQVGTTFTVDPSDSDAASTLASTLGTLLQHLAACTLTLDVVVTGDPSLVSVTVGGVSRTYGAPDGWVLASDQKTMTLEGAACDARSSGAELTVALPCH